MVATWSRKRPLEAAAVLIVATIVLSVTLLLNRDETSIPTPYPSPTAGPARGCRGLPAGPSGESGGGPFVGTLQTEAGSAVDESRAGVKMAMLEIAWRNLEPQEGVWNTGYARNLCTQLARYREAGMQVTLGLGLHFTPQWVLDRPDSRYVDQNGNKSDEADLVFNADLRKLADRYLKKVDDLLGLSNFWAVRVTSGGSSELFYPSSGDYWAFGGGPRPASLAANPLPDWRPGTGDTSPSTFDRQRWAQWYIGALADVADWQMDQLRGLGFQGYLQVLTPGQGLRPDQLAGQIAAGLPRGLFGRGAVWSWVYADLKQRDNVTAYISSVGDGSGDDDTCGTSDSDVALDSSAVNAWSASRWISRIADEYGFSLAGEVSGYPTSDSGRRHYADPSPAGLAAKAYDQARSCGFLGLYWAHDAQIQNGDVPLSVVAGQAGADAEPPQAAR